MKKLILLATITFILWNAYSRPQSVDYFHPAKGESWRYAYRVDSGFLRHAMDGNRSRSTGTGATIRHVETVKLDGMTYQKTALSYRTGPAGENMDVTYSRLAHDGIYSRRSTVPDAPEYLELPLPPKLGHRWSYQIDKEFMEREITAIGTMDIGGKIHERCVMVKSWGTVDGMSASGVTYYAPKVGVAKLSTEVGGTTFELVLNEP